MLMMIVDESAWENQSPEQMQPMMDAMDSYNDELRAGGAWVSGEGLDFSKNAKTILADDGKRTVQDGPHVSQRDQIAGFWIIEAANMDDAVAWAMRIPMKEGSVEVRALVPEDWRDAQPEPVAAGSRSN
jgi:hypothetical protein